MSAFGGRFRVHIRKRLPQPGDRRCSWVRFQIKREKMMTAHRVSPLSGTIASFLLWIALGCSEASRPLATEPGTRSPAATHNIIAPPIVLRGTILTPNG